MKKIRAGPSGIGTGKAARRRVSYTSETSLVTSVCLREYFNLLSFVEMGKESISKPDFLVLDSLANLKGAMSEIKNTPGWICTWTRTIQAWSLQENKKRTYLNARIRVNL